MSDFTLERQLLMSLNEDVKQLGRGLAALQASIEGVPQELDELRAVVARMEGRLEADGPTVNVHNTNAAGDMSMGDVVGGDKS